MTTHMQRYISPSVATPFLRHKVMAYATQLSRVSIIINPITSAHTE